MTKKYLSLFPLLIAFSIAGCSSSSSNTQAYNCTLPCLQLTPSISASSVLSATGGTVDVTLAFEGNLADVARVDIFLRDVSSGTNAGSSYVFSPTTQTLTETITIASGTPVSSYYPQILIHMNANNTSGQYYRDSSISSNEYIYYEITNGNASKAMVSSYAIPMLQVN